MKRRHSPLLFAILLAVSVQPAFPQSSDRMVRTGRQLESIAMPVGGIGGGHVSICGDGAIRQWNIFNNLVEAFVVPDSFFAIWAKQRSREPVARLLQKTPINKLPAIEDVKFVGEYPIAELSYVDRRLPVEVRLKTFSPHIPLNTRDSAIPVAVFEFTIRNKSSEPVQVSLLSSLQNPIGTNGRKLESSVRNKFYGGNVNSTFGDSRLRGILLTNPSLKPDARTPGTMAQATFSRSARTTLQWDNLHLLWQTYSVSGTVAEQGTGEPSSDGRTWNTAMTVPLTLQPSQTTKVTYLWTWHFPKRFVLWDKRAVDSDVGTMYSNWFSDAREVADYVAANYTRLAGDTEKFRKTFYKTTLPYWMLDRISAQSSTLVTSVCMWLKDGTFAAFEGGPSCCPLNCTHVFNYEQQMGYLFPELDRSMRKTDFEFQQVDVGWIRHRTRLPLSETREQMPFCDGHLGTILKAYREHRQSPDQAFLDRYWPNIKLAMQCVMDRWDGNEDGVIVGSQWNTYDATMFGPNTFIGTLYLGALRACEEMAKVKGDTEFAASLRKRFDSGSKRLDAALWTGEYYRQIEERPSESEVGENKWLLEGWPDPDSERRETNRPYGNGCHIDQFLGQWWANQLDLGYLLPADRVRTGLDSIMKFNWVEDFSKVTQTPRAFAGEGEPGMYTCTWPYGGKPKIETLYSFEVWTGLEYELAGLLIQEGKVADAYRIVKAVSDRYDGAPRKPIVRNPWAEIECGNHYVRAMSSWGMLLAAQGYTYCGPEKRIGFDPKVTPDSHASFFTGSEGWGLFTQKRMATSQTNELAIEYGKLEIKELTLRLPEGTGDRARVTLDKRFGGFDVKQDGSSVVITFDKPAVVKAGEKVAVVMKW